MSDRTNRHEMPFILPSQAQKHVTHNEALLAVDAWLQASVADRRSNPPASPAEGDCHIAIAPASGAWAGYEDELCVFTDGAWSFHAPKEGWRVWCAADERILVFGQGAWRLLQAEASFNPVPMAGINATADATNRLSVSAPATLLSHEGGDHRLKINKAAPADTASLLFQSGFSGRAEFGLAGDDNFRVKVSGDGGAWTDAIVVDCTTGAVSLPSTPAAPVAWGTISGALASQADLSAALAQKVSDAAVRGGASSLAARLEAVSRFCGPMGAPFVSGSHFDNAFHGAASATLAGAAGRLDLAPFLTAAPVTVDQIGVSVSAGVAGAEVKLVVYSADAAGWPDALLLETAALDASAAVFAFQAISFAFQPGVTYWVGCRHSSTATLRAIPLGSALNLGLSSPSLNTYFTLLRRTVPFASPAPAPWGFQPADRVANVTPPSIRFRAA